MPLETFHFQKEIYQETLRCAYYYNKVEKGRALCGLGYEVTMVKDATRGLLA
jgi:hypothetical protein